MNYFDVSSMSLTTLHVESILDGYSLIFYDVVDLSRSTAASGQCLPLMYRPRWAKKDIAIHLIKTS